MKKYFVLLPLILITSCNGFSNSPVYNINGQGSSNEGGSNVTQENANNPKFLSNDKFDGVLLTSTLRDSICKVFVNIKGSGKILTSDLIEPCKAFKELIESQPDCDSQVLLVGLKELMVPYKDRITEFHLCAAAFAKFKAFGEALIFSGANVNEKVETRTELGKLRKCIKYVFPLYISVCNGDIEFTKMLLNSGANVKEVDGYGRSSLHMAAMHDSLELVKLLVEKGANVNQEDKDRNIALHMVAMHHNLELINFLIEKGATVDAQNEDGRTLLHMAAMHDNLELIKFLMEKGANVDAQSKDGRTVLHMAAMRDNLELVNFLMEKGANVNQEDNDGNIALHIAAKEGGHSKYRDSKPKDNTGDSSVILALVGKGCKVNATNAVGRTPLHKVAEGNNYLKFITLLVSLFESDSESKRAYVNAKDNDGNTALHVAVKTPGIVPHIISSLLDNGANVDAKNNDGNTALHLVLEGLVPNPVIVSVLLAKGADVDAKNNNGKIPYVKPGPKSSNSGDIQKIANMLEAHRPDVKEKGDGDTISASKEVS